MSGGRLSSTFLSRAQGLHGSVPPDLEGALAGLVRAGQDAWPAIRLDADAFISHLAARLDADGDVLGALAALHATDLYLACACAAGDARAIDELERRYLAEMGPQLRGMGGAGAFADEVRQVLRDKLLVGKDGEPPKIASYSGQGPLKSWMRVAATRAALSLRRAERREVALDDDMLMRIPAATPDPELDHLKVRYRLEFQGAFQDALRGLSSRERNILRLYYVDELGIEQIAPMYRVHASTISRWIARIRESLLIETRRLLGERLRLSPREFESLLGLVRSQLDVSINTFLKSIAP